MTTCSGGEHQVSGGGEPGLGWNSLDSGRASAVLGERVEAAAAAAAATQKTPLADSRFPFELRDPWELRVSSAAGDGNEQLAGDAPLLAAARRPALPVAPCHCEPTSPRRLRLPRPSALVSAAHFDHCSCLSIALNSYLLFFLFLFLLFSSRSLRLGGPVVVVSRMGALLPLISRHQWLSRFSCLLMYGSVNKPAKMKMGISVVSGSLE